MNPAASGRDQLLLNASWGLGEAIVGGQVTPDIVVVDRAGGGIIDYQVGSKSMMTVPAGIGTTDQDTPAALRDSAVLTVGEARELAGVGLAIEDLYGQPVDVEWARAEGKLFVVQARPVTGLTAAAGSGEQWNDSLDGDYLWSNGNLGEALPDVMTPATWSFMELFMPRQISPPTLPGYNGWGRVGGRFYMNVSMSASLGRVAGISVRRFVRLSEPVFGKLPPAPGDTADPASPLEGHPADGPGALSRRCAGRGGTINGCQSSSRSLAGRCDELRAEIQRIDDASALADAWLSQVQPFFLEASDMLAASGAGGARALLGVPNRLAALVGEADAAILLSGQVAGDAQLASLGPLTGLARLARGDIDRATFARLYGHRGSHEAEVSVPRPAEDADWIDRAARGREGHRPQRRGLAGQPGDGPPRCLGPAGTPARKAAAARAMVARWTQAVSGREGARSELARAFWLLRAWLVRAELTGHGGDLFFLSLHEILDVLHRDESPLSAVPGRRATYETYCALPPYPALIRGRFDPVRWAADPTRRADYYDERGTIAPADDTITGLAGASGVADGVARVITQVEDAAQLGDGESW